MEQCGEMKFSTSTAQNKKPKKASGCMKQLNRRSSG